MPVSQEPEALPSRPLPLRSAASLPAAAATGLVQCGEMWCWSPGVAQWWWVGWQCLTLLRWPPGPAPPPCCTSPLAWSSSRGRNNTPGPVGRCEGGAIPGGQPRRVKRCQPTHHCCHHCWTEWGDVGCNGCSLLPATHCACPQGGLNLYEYNSN